MAGKCFTRSIFLSALLATFCVSSNSRGEILNWFRFEEDSELEDSISDAKLSDIGAIDVSFVDLPQDRNAPGGSFPRFLQGIGPNRQAIETDSTSAGLTSDDLMMVSDEYTIELLAHVENYIGNSIGIVLAAQYENCCAPSQFSWTFMIRTDGLFGADFRELIAWSSDGNRFEFHQSDIIIKEGIDYYLAAAMDAENGEITFYVQDLTNDTPMQISTKPQTFGPLHQISEFRTSGGSGFSAEGLTDEYRFSNHALSVDELMVNLFMDAPNAGDFNMDGQLTVEDIDLLSSEIRKIVPDPQFELNDDGVVNAEDLSHWVKDIKNSWIGDSNLDGEFNTTDLTQVFQAGHYEDGIAANSTWATGDWNGDGEFDTGDLVAAFNDGGFEQGQRVVANAVPEPSTTTLALLGVLVLAIFRRKAC